MKAIDEFRKRKNATKEKLEQYVEEGKTPEEALDLLQPEIDDTVKFIKEHIDELNGEFGAYLNGAFHYHQSDPVLTLIMLMMFNENDGITE